MMDNNRDRRSVQNTKITKYSNGNKKFEWILKTLKTFEYENTNHAIYYWRFHNIRFYSENNYFWVYHIFGVLPSL